MFKSFEEGLVDTFTNSLVKKFLGKEFIPRYAKYLLIFPDYYCLHLCGNMIKT